MKAQQWIDQGKDSQAKALLEPLLESRGRERRQARRLMRDLEQRQKEQKEQKELKEQKE